MNPASLIALLQLAASVLVSAQNPKMVLTMRQQAVQLGSNTVQLVTQAAAPIGFDVPKNNSIWPTAKDLMDAPYVDGPGHWARFGSTVQPLLQYASFGDLNDDGADDAAVIVNRPSVGGRPHYFLAVMLNQGGILFNIADVPLGSTVNVASHSIANGAVLLDSRKYNLLGNELKVE